MHSWRVPKVKAQSRPQIVGLLQLFNYLIWKFYAEIILLRSEIYKQQFPYTVPKVQIWQPGLCIHILDP